MNSDSKIRTMSFNIRYDEPRDGMNAWKYRKSMVVSMMQMHHIDIAGMQEVLNSQMKDLFSMLPEYGFIGVGREDGKTLGEFSPIIYLKDRFRIMNQGVFWLSETPLIPNSKGWDAAITRIVTWVEFFDKKTKKIFFFFNTHFDHMGIIATRNSAILLQNCVEEIAGESPVIITGDFNVNEYSETYKILAGKTKKGTTEKKSFKDSHYVCVHDHEGPEFTFHGFKAAEYLYEQPQNDSCKIGKSETDTLETIDYIFIKNKVEVLEHAILSDAWDGMYPSDHFPVIAGLRP